MLHATVSVRYDEYHGIKFQWKGYGYLLVQETLEETVTSSKSSISACFSSTMVIPETVSSEEELDQGSLEISFEKYCKPWTMSWKRVKRAHKTT